MDSKQLSDLAEAVTLQDDDLLLVRQGGEDKKYNSVGIMGGKDGLRSLAGWTDALLDAGGITPNGLPDTAIASQRLDAMKAAFDAYGTVAELATGKFQVGKRVTVTDRAGGVFLVGAGGVANGSTILDAGGGTTATLRSHIFCGYSNPAWVGAGGGINDDAPAIFELIKLGYPIRGNPTDTYLMKSTIVTALDVVFNLNGGIIKSEWLSGAEANTHYPRLMFDAVASNRVSIYNGTINGGRPSSDSSSNTSVEAETSPLIVVRDSRNVKLKDILLTNYGCSLYSVGGPVLFADNPYGWAAVKILNCDNVDVVNVQQTNCRREGVFIAYSRNVSIRRNKVYSVKSNYITAFHYWYCDGVVFVDNDIDVTGSSTASIVNGYSSNVKATRNKLTGSGNTGGGGGYSIDNERGEVFTAKNYKIYKNTLINSKIKGDLNLNTVFENLEITDNDITSDQYTGQCLYIGGVIKSGRISRNNLTCNGATVALALRLSSYIDGSGLQPQDTSTDVEVNDNILKGNGAISVAVPIDLGVRTKVDGLTIEGNKGDTFWTGIYAREIRGQATFKKVRIRRNEFAIPNTYPSNLSSGYGVGFILSVDASDVTSGEIVLDDIKIEGNNKFTTNTAGVYINLTKNAAKTISLARDISVDTNELKGNSTVNTWYGIRSFGDTNKFITNLNIDENIIENAVGGSGTNVEIARFNGKSRVAENIQGNNTYVLTISSEAGGDLVVKNNESNNQGTYRFGSGFVNGFSKLLVSGNGAITTSGGLNNSDFGTGANRPTSANTPLFIGFKYFDTTLGAAVTWNGSAFV